MSPLLRSTIQAGMVRNLCQDRVEIHRFTLTEDGRGGVTETGCTLSVMIPGTLMSSVLTLGKRNSWYNIVD
jgi:hypothetical protein